MSQLQSLKILSLHQVLITKYSELGSHIARVHHLQEYRPDVSILPNTSDPGRSTEALYYSTLWLPQMLTNVNGPTQHFAEAPALSRSSDLREAARLRLF